MYINASNNTLSYTQTSSYVVWRFQPLGYFSNSIGSYVATLISPISVEIISHTKFLVKKDRTHKFTSLRDFTNNSM